ncbi:MAG: hypothetical protein JWO93_1756, partial [Micrococcaceae bacterium]|nr:hypothetical protein [Micrococcaceae bacterium]
MVQITIKVAANRYGVMARLWGCASCTANFRPPSQFYVQEQQLVTKGNNTSGLCYGG